jgi:AcrR family transcriptional regulator
MILSNIQLTINDKIFLKDPMSSDLGKKIISESIELIYELGFENFTLKKLASNINSTEASVYRYFESKHKILLYLANWYWSWMDYKITINTLNLKPKDKLEIAINLLTEDVKKDNNFSIINEPKLHKIVVSESSKAYMNQEVDEDNKIGAYKAYKQLVANVSQMITEINPKYKYPQMLISTVIEGAHSQRFFTEHLPSLTNQIKGKDAIVEFYKKIVFNSINQ